MRGDTMTGPAAGVIAEATLDDVPRLSELLSVLFAQESDFEPCDEKQREGLRQIIASPDVGRILVWRDDTGPRAMVNLLFTISTAKGGRVALLEDMVVHPSLRGHSVGEKLLAAAIQFCREQRCARITLLTDRENESARRFYARQGFQVSAMAPMRLQLDATEHHGKA